MATKKPTPSKKAAKPASKSADKKPSAKSTAAPKKKGKVNDDEDSEFTGIEEDDFKMNNEDMDINMFSDSYDDDDDY